MPNNLSKIFTIIPAALILCNTISTDRDTHSAAEGVEFSYLSLVSHRRWREVNPEKMPAGSEVRKEDVAIL